MMEEQNMNRIRELRKERKLTTEQLSKMTGLSRSVISCWETGIRTPSYRNQEVMADIFNVDIDYLMGKSDVRRSVDLQSVVDGKISSMDVELVQKIKDAPDYIKRAILILLDSGDESKELENYYFNSEEKQ